MITAHCKLCGWKAKASGHTFAALATESHYRSTGHVVKFRPEFLPVLDRFIAVYGGEEAGVA